MVVLEAGQFLVSKVSPYAPPKRLPPPSLPLERKHGLSAEPVPVSAYVGSSKNLKDLKERDPFTDKPHGGPRTLHRKLTCLTQFTLGPDVVHIWSRIP